MYSYIKNCSTKIIHNQIKKQNKQINIIKKKTFLIVFIIIVRLLFFDLKDTF